VRKSGVLEHKSGNISETRKDRWQVTMEGLWELAIALFLWPRLPQDWRFATPTQNCNRYYLRNA